jgi:hypothetical protein
MEVYKRLVNGVKAVDGSNGVIKLHPTKET